MEEWESGLVRGALFVCRAGEAPRASPELAVPLPFRVDTGGSGYEAGIWPLRSGMLENIPWLSQSSILLHITQSLSVLRD